MAYGGVQVPRTLLCVNVSNVAALRATKGGGGPGPVEAAAICAKTGCNSIAVHLYEDRRHIKDGDVFAIRRAVTGKFNLEIALSNEIAGIAKEVRPDRITIVPEKKEQMTAKGGLDVKKNMTQIKNIAKLFHDQDIKVSLLVEPDIETIELSKESGADFIEIHTGAYCNVLGKAEIDKEIERIYSASEHAVRMEIRINAGIGLNYKNVVPLLNAPELLEVNIGHAIISRSDSVGLEAAVQEMMEILD